MSVNISVLPPGSQRLLISEICFLNSFATVLVAEANFPRSLVGIGLNVAAWFLHVNDSQRDNVITWSGA